MITVKRLKELLKDLPDDAKCYAYEGESIGINIRWEAPFDFEFPLSPQEGKTWWITTGDDNSEETYTEGFDNKEKIV